MTTLLTVPNISEGRDRATIEGVAAAFAPLPLTITSGSPNADESVTALRAFERRWPRGTASK